MAKYKVLVESFIDNNLVQEGEIIEFDGLAGSNLELVDEEPKASKKGGKAVKDEAEDLA